MLLRSVIALLALSVSIFLPVAPTIAATPGGNGALLVHGEFDDPGVPGDLRLSVFSDALTLVADVGYGHAEHASTTSWNGQWALLGYNYSWGPGDTSEVSLVRTGGGNHRPFRFARSNGTIVNPDVRSPAAFLADGTIAIAEVPGEVTIVDTDMNVVRRDGKLGAASLTLPGASTQGYSAMGSDGTLYTTRVVSGATQLFVRSLDSETFRLVAAALPANSTADPIYVYDVAPDNAAVLIVSERFGIQEVVLGTGGVRTVAPDPAGDSYYKNAKYSPDGRLVHATLRRTYVDNAGETTDAVATFDRGTGARTDLWSRAHTHLTVLAQVPIPAAPELKLTAAPVFGDVVEVDRTTTNATAFSFVDLVTDNGDAGGIILNNQGYSEAYRGGFRVLRGPSPALAPAIGPGATELNQYLVEATSPGYFTIRSAMRGVRQPGSVAFEARSNWLTVHVAPRTPEEWERFIMMTGGYVDLANRQRDHVAGEIDRTLKLVNTQIGKLPGLTKAEKAQRMKASPQEKAIARALGLPDDALGWLPNDPKEAGKLLYGFQKARMTARYKEFGAELKTQTGKVSYAAKFWHNQAFGPDSAKVPVMPILMEGPANKLITLESWAYRAGEISAQPDADEQFARLANEAGTKMWNGAQAKVRGSMFDSINKRNALIRGVTTDNTKGFEAWGAAVGQSEAKGAIEFTKQVIGPDKGKILAFAKQGAGVLKKRGIPDIDFSANGVDAEDFADVVPGRKPTVEATGMSKVDQETAKRVLRDVEADVLKSTGQKIELEMSFRERNVHSSALGDAAMGKIGLFTTKAGTDVDVMLGMDRRALGKAVFYKPTLPAYFDTLDDDLRHALIVRRQDMLEQWRKYTAPGSAARKAATKAGTTYQNKGPKGVVTSSIKVKTDEVFYDNGTIVLRYKELTVDGIKVVTAKKPKWVASDYDGNRVGIKGGGNLPASVSSMAQLKLNRRLIQAARDDGFSFGMHGFSFNAIDLTSDPNAKFRQRDVLRYLLEGMRGPDRERMLKDYLRKYGPNDYMDLLAKSETGKYVIKVTSGGVDTATGL